jgi:hypothetical protein
MRMKADTFSASCVTPPTAARPFAATRFARGAACAGIRQEIADGGLLVSPREIANEAAAGHPAAASFNSR